MLSLGPSAEDRPPRNFIFATLQTLFGLVLILRFEAHQQAFFAECVEVNRTYFLGFLAPEPGTDVPTSLATQWTSAFQVAVDVLNAGRSYRLETYVENSDCSSSSAQEGAHKLMQQDGLIGAIGPTCSGAALAAAMIFDDEGPAALVSFSATAEPLSNRTFFPTFFRTVYTDSHQAQAVVATIKSLNGTSATILYTKDYYSTNLATQINQTAGGLLMCLLQPGFNTSVNKEQLKVVLDSLVPGELVILVVQPVAAQDVWTMASELDKIKYPWWYFGTDGATAFDLGDIDPKILNRLAGQIGLAPYGGELSPTRRIQCHKFYKYWKQVASKHPGLPALEAYHSRSYVPYLFDAVWAFFTVIDSLLEAGLDVTRSNVLESFYGRGNRSLRFDGCTGVVEFDPTTGARSTSAQLPVYDLLSMTTHTWELKGKIQNATLVDMLPLGRPGNISLPAEDLEESSKETKGATKFFVVGIVFLVGAIILLTLACCMYFVIKI